MYPVHDVGSEFIVGRRYLHGKTLRPVTLRYIGTLPREGATTSQIWLGIEYDDPSFGKHSGHYEDDQIFNTRLQGSGAFLKATKGALKRGKTFIEAFEERYGPINPIEAPVEPVERAVEIVNLGNSGIEVEAPGMADVQKRIGKLEKLREISLEGEWVTELGGDGALHARLRERLKAVHTVNMSRNLLHDWGDIGTIVQNLVNVKTLVLNQSYIASLPVDAQDCIRGHLEDSLQPLSQIEELHLGDSGLEAQDIASLSQIFPRLQVLHIGDNSSLSELTSISTDATFNHLENLSLSGCPISDWAETAQILSRFPRLNRLDLSRTALANVLDSEDRLSLESLTLLDTSITDWAGIDAIESCTRGTLKALRISPIGLDPPDAENLGPSPQTLDDPARMTGIARTDRPMLIAKLSGLTSLNLSPITPAERRDAEEWYVKHVRQLREAGDTSIWGRYDELSKTHGLLVPAPAATARSAVLKSRMINIRAYISGEMIDMTILPSAPVALLRKKISRRVQSETGLTLWTGKENGQAYVKVAEMEDGQEVGWWLSDGDVVVVED